YDLARLLTGSFGCLAVITAATFKLYPVTAASATVIVDLPSSAAAGALTLAINGSRLTPTAVELQLPPLRMLIRFESIDASVTQQASEAVRLAEACGGRVAIVRGEAEDREWRAHGLRPWAGDGAVVKATLLPSELASLLDALRASSVEVEAIGHAGLGVLTIR